MGRQQAIISIGLMVGAIGAGAVASAVEVDDQPTSAVETTTTVEGVTSSEPAESSTTTTETTSTTLAVTTTEVPETMAPGIPAQPDDPSTAKPDKSNVHKGAHGLCNAFSGRPQPGNSQGWQRLHDAAGGDIDTYCSEVLASRAAEKAERRASPEPTEPETPKKQPDAKKGPPGQAKAKGADNGKGKDKGPD